MRVQKTISLHEYESVIAELDALDADLLNSKFNKKLSVDKYSDNQYKITATQFVGVISLHNHIIIIRPKLDNLNFSYVFSYANQFDVFGKEDFDIGGIEQRLCIVVVNLNFVVTSDITLESEI